MTIHFHHKVKENVYHIDINGVDHIMTRSYGRDNNGIPLEGQWAVYNELTGELITHGPQRRVIRKRLLIASFESNVETIDVPLSTVKPGDLIGIPELMTVETFIPEDGRQEQSRLIKRHGDKKVLEVYDGTVFTFPSTSYTNVCRWALLEDGSVIGFNESPRSGWSFPRLGLRAQANFYLNHKCSIPVSMLKRYGDHIVK